MLNVTRKERYFFPHGQQRSATRNYRAVLWIPTELHFDNPVVEKLSCRAAADDRAEVNGIRE